MYNKNLYHMSEVGECSRVLAAKRMGQKPTPQTAEDLRRLNHYTRLEAVAADQISDLGYKLEMAGHCKVCQDRYGNDRSGIHVEMDTALFTLVGHLDRRILINGLWYPVEIKSLGKASWTKFQHSQFKAFPGYAGQECAYLTAENVPGIYWIMDRDSGEPQKYIVNDTEGFLKLTGFQNIELPVDFTTIEDKLNEIEISVQAGVLPVGIESDSCFFCKYKFLCIKEEDEGKAVKNVTNPDLITAAEEYKYGNDLEKTAEEIKIAARASLLLHCKQNNIEKYLVSGLSVSYRGQRTKNSINADLLQKENPELYQLCLRQSSPFDDYTIRILKEKT